MMIRRPRLAAWPLLAALVGAGVGVWAEVARADPPPLIIPGPEPEPAAPVATPVAVPAPASASGTAPKSAALTEKRFQFGKFTITADHGTGDVGSGSGTASGNVEISSDSMDLKIHADQLTSKDQGFETTGQVELTLEGLRVLTRKAEFDRQQQVLTLQTVRFGKSPAYVDGSNFTVGTDKAAIENATLYFGEPDPFGVNVHAPSATYDPATQAVTLHGATLRLGSVPFFYVPSYTQGQADNPPISLQAHFGYRNDVGPYTRTTTFFTKNPDWAPGVLLDYYGKRGLLAGPALKYNTMDNPDWWQDGTLESAFIRDSGNRGLDLTGRPVPEDRFFLDWQHRGSLGGFADVTSTLSWWSDSNVLRDFRQDIWNNDQLPDNFVEVTHREENATMSVFGRYRQDNFELVQERLPEVRMDYFPTAIGNTGIYQEGEASYAQLIQNNFNGTPTLHSNRLDAYYGWRRPLDIGGWATITPVAGIRVTQYEDTLDDQGQFTRMLGQVGFDGEMRATGRWDVNSDIWDIHGLQHVVRPVMMYRYIPAAQQGQGLIPVIDNDAFSNYPPIFDLGDTRSVDQLHSENVLRLGLENLFQTRAKDYGSRDLFSLNIYNDFHFQRATDQEDFSDIWTEVGVDPAPWLKFEVFDRMDPGALANREVRTRTTITDGDRLKVALVTDELQHTLDQYWLEARYKISERLSLVGRWDYDEHLGGLIQQVYGVRQRLGEAWDVEYGLAYYRAAGAQSGFGFNFRIYLLQE